ncbi:response regulator transcription factor [Paenibacillus sp. FSL H3-0310]|uniref:response regulator transcription factor n=1 Tax=Paenibacillus sp. FSL H3-0310 TaxID=2921429 RepID=UPI0030FCB479
MSEQMIWYMSAGNGRGEEELDAIAKVFNDIGLQITKSEDPEDLRLSISEVEPVLLLADLGEVGTWEGWKIISAVRDEGMILPVMVISEELSGNGAVAAFLAGGNDFMTKPLHTGEFKCRILNLLTLTGRRRNLKYLLKVDGLMLDPSRRLVTREGIELKMTHKEFDLLYYLAANRGIICSREEILKQVWGYQFHADTNVVDVYIRHIRLKIDKGYRNKLIHTVRGTGYVMRVPEGSTTS